MRGEDDPPRAAAEVGPHLGVVPHDGPPAAKRPDVWQDAATPGDLRREDEGVLEHAHGEALAGRLVQRVAERDPQVLDRRAAPPAVDPVVGAADPAGCGLGGGRRDRDEERGRGAEGGVLHHVPGP